MSVVAVSLKNKRIASPAIQVAFSALYRMAPAAYLRSWRIAFGDLSRSQAWQTFFFFQAEDVIRDIGVTGVQTCALPIWLRISGPQQYTRSMWLTLMASIRSRCST